MKNSKKKFSLIACALLAAFGACVGAQEIDFSGTVGTSWAMAAPWTDNAGDFTFGRVYFDGKLDAWYNESSALVDASVGYDNTTRNLFFSLNEAWADYSSSNWGIRVGRQKTSWGKADGITVTNIICPEDMSSLFADDTTMGIDSVRLSVTGSAFTVDAWWIPFFRGSKLPLEENNPLRKMIVPQPNSFHICSPVMSPTKVFLLERTLIFVPKAWLIIWVITPSWELRSSTTMDATTTQETKWGM